MKSSPPNQNKGSAQRNTAIIIIIILLLLLFLYPRGNGCCSTTTVTTTSNGSTITTTSIISSSSSSSVISSSSTTLCGYCGPNTLFRTSAPQITPSTISVSYGSSVQVNVQAGITGTVQLNGGTFASITPNGYQTIMPGQAVSLTSYFNPSLLTHGTYYVTYWVVDQNGNRISSKDNYSIGL